MRFRTKLLLVLLINPSLANTGSAGAASVTTAPPPITAGLMIELNGETLTTAGGLSIWQDQANDGNPGSFQNFVQATAARQPTVVLDDLMPNGLTANVIRFDRGSTTGTNSSGTSTDYMRGVADGVDADTTAGADQAYKLSQLSYFVVFQSTLTPSLLGDNRDRQLVIEANHTGANATWVTQTLQDGYDADGNITTAGGTPDLYNAVRDDPTVLNQVGRGVPDIIQNRWYIAATGWNTTSRDTRIVIRDDQGNLLDKSFQISTAFDTGLADHIGTIIGAHGSGSNAPSNSTGQGFTGGIAELLFYDTALNNTDMDSVLKYLNNKYFVPPAIGPGDYNGDGKVNAADYVLWRKDPNAFGGDPGYVAWRDNFGVGEGAGGGLGGGLVPEPSVLFASASAAVLCLFGARRRSTRLCN
jgi:hypothetical protein